MKISEQPTQWLAIKACTNAEFDECDFIVLKLTPMFMEDIISRTKIINQIPNDAAFYHSCWWCGTDGWYVYGEDMDDEESNDYFYSELQEELEDKMWCYLEMEGAELPGSNLNITDQTVDSEQMLVQPGNIIGFKGYGKYTSDEFWTEDIDVQQIINDYIITNTHVTR